MNFAQLANGSFVEEPFGGSISRIPRHGPINGKQFSRGLHDFDHFIGIGERRGKRFFEDDVNTVRGNFFNPPAMRIGFRTEQHDVGLQPFKTVIDIRKEAVLGNLEPGRCIAHPLWLFIAKCDDFRLWMLVGHPQVISHMHMVEINASDFPGHDQTPHEFVKDRSIIPA
jgi:hypothetical protein